MAAPRIQPAFCWSQPIHETQTTFGPGAQQDRPDHGQSALTPPCAPRTKRSSQLKTNQVSPLNSGSSSLSRGQAWTKCERLGTLLLHVMNTAMSLHFCTAAGRRLGELRRSTVVQGTVPARPISRLSQCSSSGRRNRNRGSYSLPTTSRTIPPHTDARRRCLNPP